MVEYWITTIPFKLFFPFSALREKKTRLYSKINLIVFLFISSVTLIVITLIVGLKYVISGTFRNVECSTGRYQPVRFWSNQNSDCLFSKSQCTGVGQIVHDNSSTIYDATCRCDYTIGYAFVSRTQNPCFCNPSEEDCSCYIKYCPANTTLSPSKYSLERLSAFYRVFLCVKHPVWKLFRKVNTNDLWLCNWTFNCSCKYFLIYIKA